MLDLSQIGAAHLDVGYINGRGKVGADAGRKRLQSEEVFEGARYDVLGRMVLHMAQPPITVNPGHHQGASNIPLNPMHDRPILSPKDLNDSRLFHQTYTKLPCRFSSAPCLGDGSFALGRRDWLTFPPSIRG